MQDILYYIRDHLVGTHYIIYSLILLTFMFALIGYLFKQKYAKYEIKLDTSQKKVDDSSKKDTKNEVIKQKNNKEVKVVDNKSTSNVINNVQTQASTIAKNPTPIPVPATKPTPNPIPMPNNNTVVNPTPVASQPKQTAAIPEI